MVMPTTASTNTAPAGLPRPGIEEQVVATMVPLRKRFDLKREDEHRFSEGFRRTSGLTQRRKAH